MNLRYNPPMRGKFYRIRQKRISSFLPAVMILILVLQGCNRVTRNESTPESTEPSITTQVPEGTEPPTSLEAGDHSLRMQFDGLERSYVVHIPPGVDGSEKIALVLAFHGIGLDAAEMMRISGLSDQADASGFIVVYPEGTGKLKSWNGGHCCGEAAKNDVDDVGFVRALIEELSNTLPIDPEKIFVTGFSNGAIFTYRLACELSDVVAAFAPVSATPAQLDMDVCTPSRPVPIIHFHGTADEANPYDGGTFSSGFYFLSVRETIDFWVEQNNCSGDPEVSETGSIKHEVYGSCDEGAIVELYTVEGGMHAWPGGEAVSAKMGEPTMEIDASSLIWEYFKGHLMH